jgi:Na+/H+ antiporter NhaD/arsenite permease-like protein
MRARLPAALLALILFLANPRPAAAVDALPGEALAWPWALPFIGVLATIAIGPAFRNVWHDHYGKIAGSWAVLIVAALAIAYGIQTALAAFAHAMLAEYLSFIVLLFALYTVAGGILVTGTLSGTPGSNTLLLAFGTAIASVVGTTGAAMILIRPLLRANEQRRSSVHVVVFFIFLVANVGGALSPLGDPPLFVGFLRGVDFFWTTRHLAVETVLLAGFLLACFYVVDSWFARRDPHSAREEPAPPRRIRVRGLVNLVLIGAITGVILVTALWTPSLSINVLDTELALETVARDGLLVLIAILSLLWTREEHRLENGFTWEPIREVAKLFAAIFIAIIPVLAMLRAGEAGAFAPLIDFVASADGAPDPLAYFWVTGFLSAFLDNAPTYLVFFELAGGDPERLMGQMAGILAAISMGAVYMGALTYIGNAPNLMVHAIAEERGLPMPSFFAYFGWACLFLLPPLLLLSLIKWML